MLAGEVTGYKLVDDSNLVIVFTKYGDAPIDNSAWKKKDLCKAFPVLVKCYSAIKQPLDIKKTLEKGWKMIVRFKNTSDVIEWVQKNLPKDDWPDFPDEIS